MALTQTRTESDSTERIEPSSKPALEQLLSTSDHKTVGRMWVVSGVVIALFALALSAATGFEHMNLGSVDLFEDEGQFTQAWSMGRTLLLFGGVVPILVGLATYLAPLQVGSSAIAFGRGAAAAFWTWLLSTLVLVLAYIGNGGPAGGVKDAVLLWILAFGTVVLAICWALVCIATTILGARTVGLRMDRLPASTWAYLVFALLGLMSLPILIGELGLAYIDVTADYLADKQARMSLLSVTTSISLAPALYWISIPVLGMAIDIVQSQTGRPVRFHRLALSLLGSLGLLAFAADTLSFGGRGRPVDFNNAILVIGVLAAVLPILLLLSLALDSVKSGSIPINTPLVGSLLSMALLLVGSAVSLLAQIEPIVGFIEKVSGRSVSLSSALSLNGSAFHDGIRGLIVGATFLGCVGAIHHWAHKIWGRSLDDKLGMVTLLLGLVGTLAWGVGMVGAGFLGEPALPVISTGLKSGVEALNTVAAIGFVSLAGAAALLTMNVVRTAFGGGSLLEPWSGSSLEWMTSSPPPVGNFTEAPVLPPASSVERDSLVGAPASDSTSQGA